MGHHPPGVAGNGPRRAHPFPICGRMGGSIPGSGSPKFGSIPHPLTSISLRSTSGTFATTLVMNIGSHEHRRSEYPAGARQQFAVGNGSRHSLQYLSRFITTKLHSDSFNLSKHTAKFCKHEYVLINRKQERASSAVGGAKQKYFKFKQ